MMIILTNEIVKNYIDNFGNSNTKETYKYAISQFRKFLSENYDNKLDSDKVDEILDNFKSFLIKKGLNYKTINSYLINVRKFLKTALNLKFNKELKFLRGTNKEPSYLTYDEIQKAIEYSKDDLDRIMILLLSNTGLRLNEALSIKKEDLNDTDENGDIVLEVHGKRDKIRYVVIPEFLVLMLKEFSKNSDEEYVFASPKKSGQPLSRRTIDDRFKKLAHEIDLEEDTDTYSKNLKPHNLRHSYAIYALDTLGINYVKEYLGHNSLKTTQIYTNLKKKDVIKQAKTLKWIT